MRRIFPILLILFTGYSCSQNTVPEEFIFPQFTNVIEDSQISHKLSPYALCAGDINEDGFPDLMASYHSHIQLYVNNGNATFTGKKEMIKGRDDHGVSLIDFNEDQKLGLAVSCGSKKGKAKGSGNFYANFNKDGQITEVVGVDSTMLDPWGRGRVIVPCDYNSDGILDMILVNFDAGLSPNNFTNVFLGTKKRKSILKHYQHIKTELDKTRLTSMAIVSLFNDERQFVLGLRGGPDAGRIYEIKKNLKIKDLTKTFNVKTTSALQGIRPIDYDNDGDLDLLYFQNGRDKVDNLPVIFYENNGKTFRKKNVGIKGNGKTTDSVVGDFNNDGFQDVYIINTHYKAPQPDNFLYMNNGKKGFVRIPISYDMPIVKEAQTTHFGQKKLYESYKMDLNNGCLGFDYDSDGDIDIFTHNAIHKKYGNIALLRNDTESIGNYISIMPQSQYTTTWGTRVIVKYGEHTQYQQKYASNCKLGVSDLPLHFGVGHHEKVDIEIIWPSGNKTELKKVNTNQTLNIQEKR